MTSLDTIPAAPYDPPMALIAKCEDCGHEWHQTEGDVIVVSALPGVEIMTFDEPPHRLFLWQCECGAEIGVWADREGRAIAAPKG